MMEISSGAKKVQQPTSQPFYTETLPKTIDVSIEGFSPMFFAKMIGQNTLRALTSKEEEVTLGRWQRSKEETKSDFANHDHSGDCGPLPVVR